MHFAVAMENYVLYVELLASYVHHVGQTPKKKTEKMKQQKTHSSDEHKFWCLVFIYAFIVASARAYNNSNNFNIAIIRFGWEYEE